MFYKPVKFKTKDSSLVASPYRCYWTGGVQLHIFDPPRVGADVPRLSFTETATYPGAELPD